MPAKQNTKTATTTTSKGKKQVVEEPVVEEQVVEEHEEEVEELEDGEEEEVEEAEVEEAEDGDKKKKKYEYVCETVEAGFAEVKRIDSEIKELMKYREAVLKSTEKFAHKQLKQTKKRRQTESSEKKEPNGFVKPKAVPEKFKAFHESHLKNCKGFTEAFPNYDSEANAPRTEITKMIYHYIRTNDLYNKKADGTLDKRSIAPNAALKALFDIKKGDLIFDHLITEEDIKEEKREDPKERERIGQKAGMTFSNFQTYMNRLYESDEEVEVEAEEAEAVEEAPKVSKPKKTVVATK